MRRFEADKQTGSDVTGRGVSGKHKEDKAVETRIIVACAIMRRLVLAEETAMSRQKKGFYLTLASLVALIGIYAAALLLFRTTSVLQMFLGLLLTLLPLVYWLPFVWRRQGKAFAVLALFAPLHLFFGGVIWLWGQPWWGAAICFCAISLQIGTIMHNYDGSRRKARKAARRAGKVR